MKKKKPGRNSRRRNAQKRRNKKKIREMELEYKTRRNEFLKLEIELLKKKYDEIVFNF